MAPELLYLSEQVQEAYDKLANDLVLGTVKDHSEYRYFTGIARGYALVNGMIADLARRLDQEEDDDR
jgi:hypothetical protein